MKTSPLVIALILSVPSPSLFADSIKTEPLDRQQHEYLQQLQTDAATDAISGGQTAAPERLTDEQLLQNPQLLEHIFRQALNSNDAELIRALLNTYLRLPQADTLLIHRAQGTLQRLNNQHRAAIRSYTELTKQHPQDIRLRLDLAAIKYENRQWRDAENDFRQLSAEQELPEAVYRNISLYRQRIASHNQWQFQAALSPAYHTNINDAAPRYCLYNGLICSTDTPQNAWAVNWQLSAAKNTPLAGNHNLRFRSHIEGNSYYTARQSQYDDAFGRAYLGWHWQDKRQYASLLPFYQAQFSGSSDFTGKSVRNRRIAPYMLAHATGIQAAYGRHLTSRWQIHVSWEHYRSRHRENQRAERHNGRQDNLFLSASYRSAPHTALFTSYQYSRFSPQKKTLHNATNNAAYHRHSFGAGWLQHWPQIHINSKISINYAQRRYRGTAAFSDQSQRNSETTAAVSFNKSDWQWHGFTPSLNWQHQRIRSNQPWAQRTRKQLFVSIEKDF